MQAFAVTEVYSPFQLGSDRQRDKAVFAMDDDQMTPTDVALAALRAFDRTDLIEEYEDDIREQVEALRTHSPIVIYLSLDSGEFAYEIEAVDPDDAVDPEIDDSCAVHEFYGEHESVHGDSCAGRETIDA